MAAPIDRLHSLQLKLERVEAELVEARKEHDSWFESGWVLGKARRPIQHSYWEWYTLSRRQINGLLASKIMLKTQILEEERGAADYVIEEGELENLFAEIVNENEVETVGEIADVKGTVAVINNAIVGVRTTRFSQPPPAHRYTPVIECFVCNFEPGYDGHLLTDCFYAMVTMGPAKFANFLKFQARCFRCFQKAGFGAKQHNSMTCKHPRWCDKHVYGTRDHHAVLCSAGPILKTQQDNNNNTV